MLIGKQLCNKRALSNFYFSVYQSTNVQVNQIHIKNNFRMKYHDFHCRSTQLDQSELLGSTVRHEAKRRAQWHLHPLIKMQKLKLENEGLKQALSGLDVYVPLNRAQSIFLEHDFIHVTCQEVIKINEFYVGL